MYEEGCACCGKTGGVMVQIRQTCYRKLEANRVRDQLEEAVSLLNYCYEEGVCDLGLSRRVQEFLGGHNE